MRKILAIIILFAFFGCNNNQSKKEINNPKKIRICRVYSSDFGLIDNESPGQLIQEFYFNKEGHVRELRRYGGDGKVIGRFEIDGESSPFPIDKSMNLIDTSITDIQYGTMGDIRKKEVKTYSETGFLIEVLLYNSADSLKQKNTYEYNAEGYISKDIYWDTELNVPIETINYRYEYLDN